MSITDAPKFMLPVNKEHIPSLRRKVSVISLMLLLFACWMPVQSHAQEKIEVIKKYKMEGERVYHFDLSKLEEDELAFLEEYSHRNVEYPTFTVFSVRLPEKECIISVGRVGGDRSEESILKYLKGVLELAVLKREQYISDPDE